MLRYKSLSPVLSLVFVQVFLAGQLMAQAQPMAENKMNDALGAVVAADYPSQSARAGFGQHGVLLNTNGWAVFSLDMVSYREPPVFRNSKGELLEFKKVLAVDRNIGIAIVELDYPDSPALSIAARPPEPWHEVALLWVNGEEEGSYLGPVLARRPVAQYGPGSPEFLCLGMRISRASAPVTTGSPVINAAGDLVGVLDTIELDGPNYPLRVLAVSSEPIEALLKKAKANPEGLPFPLKSAYPYDAAYWEYTLPLATAPRDSSPQIDEEAEKQAEKIARLQALVAKHPGSGWAAEQLIHALTEDLVMLADDDPAAPRKTGALLEALKLHEHKLRNPLVKLAARTVPLSLSGDYKKLIDLRLNELKKWGESPPLRHLMGVADSYLQEGDKEAAKEFYEQIARVAPDSLFNLYQYQSLLVAMGDYDEEERIGDLIDRVEDAYRPR